MVGVGCGSQVLVTVVTVVHFLFLVLRVRDGYCLEACGV